MTDLRVLTIKQVAELVQLSPRTVMRAVRAGDLDASQLTQSRGGWRIEEPAIAAWLAARSNHPRHRRLPEGLVAEVASAPRRPSVRSRVTLSQRKADCLMADRGSKPPRRPDTPRGVEPRLRRAADGWTWRFRVRWTDPASGRRPVEEFDTIEEALDFIAYLRLAKRRGVLEDLTRGETTLAEFFENEYWPKDAQRNLQRNTRKTYLPVWYAHLKPRLGHLQLRQLNPPTIQLLREHMEEDGVGAPTIRRSMAILQAVCRYAMAKGQMTTNPVKEVRKPPVKRSLAIVAISPTQIESLRRLLLDGYVELRVGKDGKARRVEHRPDIRSATLVSLIAYEGLRPEEALALEDRHVGKGTLLIEQKDVDGEIVTGQKTGRPPRSPDLWPPVRTDLAEYQLATRRPTTRDGRQLLIPRADGDPWREHDYRNWRRRVFQAGDRRRRPSDHAPVRPPPRVRQPDDPRRHPAHGDRRPHGSLHRGALPRLRAPHRRHARAAPDVRP